MLRHRVRRDGRGTAVAYVREERKDVYVVAVHRGSCDVCCSAFCGLLRPFHVVLLGAILAVLDGWSPGLWMWNENAKWLVGDASGSGSWGWG